MCITHNTIEKKWFSLNRWVGVCGDVCLEQHKGPVVDFIKKSKNSHHISHAANFTVSCELSL